MKKKNLLKENAILRAVIKHQGIAIINKNAQIRHFRIRLKKIRHSIDYLLEHPFSTDTCFNNTTEKRDK